MAVYVALWDCPTCGRKGNLGPHTKCSGCGSSRPRNVHFYLPEDPLIVESEEELRVAESGADWVCRHCDAHNKIADTICYSCGNPKDDAEDEQLKEVEYGLEDVPKTGEIPRELNVNEKKYAESQQVPNRTIPIMVGVFLILAAFLIIFTTKRETTVSVQKFEWARTVQLEHNEPVQREAWDTPSGAYNVSSFRAIHHYDKVFDRYITRTRWVKVPAGTRRYVCGRTSRGNGYFSDRYCTETVYRDKQETYQEPIYRDVPVYRTKYRFTIMEWVGKETLKTAQFNQQPQWATSSYLQQQDWREGPKTEQYWVYVKDRKNNLHKEQIPYTKWSKLSTSSKLPARERWISGKYLGLVEEEKK